MTDTAPYDQDSPDALDELADELTPVVGDFVAVSWQDPYDGREVIKQGVVVDVDDGGAVRVGYFAEVTGPLPLDHTAHDREDAPRVRVLTTSGG